MSIGGFFVLNVCTMTGEKAPQRIQDSAMLFFRSVPWTKYHSTQMPMKARVHTGSSSESFKPRLEIMYSNCTHARSYAIQEVCPNAFVKSIRILDIPGTL